MTVRITINDIGLEAAEGLNLLQAAQRAGIYIPALCYHPDLPPFAEAAPSPCVYQGPLKLEGTAGEKYQGCGLCVVDIKGEGLKYACNTPVKAGMAVLTGTPEVQEARRCNLAAILASHPHECLFCPQREGCDRHSCSMNVPESERCCDKFNSCDLRRVTEYIGGKLDIARCPPRQSPPAEDGPLFRRDYYLCIGCTRCVRACQDAFGAGALGYISSGGKTVVGMVSASPLDSGCRFCGACVEVCPTGALSDKDIKRAGREADLVPCREACPAGIDIPRYVRLIAAGDFAAAIATIREKVPLPAVLGRVCFHPCQDVCRRGAVNDAICIKELKRFAADYEIEPPGAPPASQTGARVAVIGSGPAGLSAAYYLARLGHPVTVFEAHAGAGGMLRAGIPRHRLPREILDKEIEGIKKAGVAIKTGSRVSSLDELLARGYQAIFIATGAPKGTRLGVTGEDDPAVSDGITLLRKVNLGEEVSLGKRVAVVGGGNVAIDAARSALRLGANEVTILYRRSRQEMPASKEEVAEAIEEGVKIDFLVTPERITRKSGALEVTCVRLELGAPDTSGRRRPVIIKNSSFVKTYDNVVTAIGQVPDIPANFNLALGKDGTLQVNGNTLVTSREGVFAGGDAVTGPASVIEAVAAGRKAAVAIDRFLGGRGEIDPSPAEVKKPDFWLGRDEGFGRKRKIPVTVLAPEERKSNFKEVSLGYALEQAMREAGRCLRCDLRLALAPPAPPPEAWLDFKAENVEVVPAAEGVCTLYDADRQIIYIKGAMNIRNELQEQLNSDTKARFFMFEEALMYTQRENELLQEFLQQHGCLPKINIGGDLEDLF